MKHLYCLFLALISISIQSQTGENDLHFNTFDDGSYTPNNSFDNSIRAIGCFPDGKYIVGGDFTAFNSLTLNRIALIDTYGNPDTSFVLGSGFDGNVTAIAIDSNNRIIIGGLFNSYNGISANKLVRLNLDGTIDTTFNIGVGFDNDVLVVKIDLNGKILVGGKFYNFDNSTANRLIRLNQNGSKDTTFDTGTGFNGNVESLAFQNDNKIIVGGNFLSYNGTNEKKLVRLNDDGTIDLNFNTGTCFQCSFNATVRTIGIFSNGKIVVGGAFSLFNNISVKSMVLLNSDGSRDLNFNNQMLTNGVNSLQVLDNNKIIFAGSPFQTVPNIYIIDSLGNQDFSFDYYNGCNDIVYTVNKDNNNKFLVGGKFTKYYNGTEKKYIARILRNGKPDPLFSANHGFNVNTYSSELDSNDLLVGGTFTSFNGNAVNQLVKLNHDGGIDTNFYYGRGPTVGSNSLDEPTVWNIKKQNDGKITVSGTFAYFNGYNSNGMVRLHSNGIVDSSFNLNLNSSAHYIYDFVQQLDDKYIIGGGFTNAFFGINANRIARILPDGSYDSTFVSGSGFNNTVNDLKLQADGKCLVGGIFSSYNGTSRSGIVRLNTNGSLDTSFNTPLSLNLVKSILILPDSTIILVGSFAFNFNGVKRNIIKLKYDGSIDSTFNYNNILLLFSQTVNSRLHDIVYHPSGNLIITGSLSNGRGITSMDINGQINIDFQPGVHNSSILDIIHGLNVQNDGKILYYGYFDEYNYTTKHNIGRLLYFPYVDSVVGNETICDTVSNATISVFSSFTNPIFEWYDSANGGTLLYTGPTFTTPILTTSTTFYIKTISGNLSSNIRDSITINIGTPITVNQNINICNGQNVSIGANIYNATGMYSDTLINMFGCDSIINTNLLVNPSYSFVGYDTICQGDSVLIFGNYQKTTGIYYDSLQSSIGCDSINSIELFVNSNYFTNANLSICQGDSVLINGNYQSVSGIYIDSLQALLGCDSIVNYNLTINPSYSIASNDTLCQGDSVLIFGNYQNLSGIYTDSLLSIQGCDSIILITVFIDSSLVSFFSSTADPNDSLNLLVTNLATGNNLQYFWEFGDGNTSYQPYPLHVYASIGTYNLCLTVTDSVANCTVIYCETVSKSTSNGIQSIQVTNYSTNTNNISTNNKARLYPNPSSNTFILDFGTNLETQVNVFSIEGKKMLSKYSNNDKIIVNVSTWSKGIYLVYITINKKSSVMKFIKL